MGFIRRFSRLAWLSTRAPKLPPLDIYDVCRSPRRVWIGDLDELRHMNNGAYLSNLDHARQELVVRTGLWRRMRDAGMYPVVGAQMIAYRRSLELGQRYVIESRFLGLDDRAAYLEQRFVVDGEVYARAYVQGRFLYDRGGTVPMDELARVSGMDPTTHPLPEWMHDWASRIRLPGTRTPAPSTWD
ncbi:MAG: thioesterase family protein [Micrococcales bacterium]|nr:thioesterase family protein [Micrococcales bacterium]